ncbi:polyhydroxyalkanoic acid system family protein [Propionivibrio soli]|uniref:polyhydroxyalkanoic acid system family protein n=1 Tax=Propionivibrio soli TaxID=2976531 RepID=UPI0021E7BBED|nr:polyhydroxyalkanoic acid system family protein [Propionivibrio soli]
MNEIVICRKHNKTPAAARQAADLLVREIAKELALDMAWTENVMRFQRPGVFGEITIGEAEVIVVVRLGALFVPLKPSIEQALLELLDASLGSE